jgi:hypothetical protein
MKAKAPLVRQLDAAPTRKLQANLWVGFAIWVLTQAAMLLFGPELPGEVLGVIPLAAAWVIGTALPWAAAWVVAYMTKDRAKPVEVVPGTGTGAAL